jgi:hypothetical protein
MIIKIYNNIMGNRETKFVNDCIEELSKINKENLDISNIDKLQIKAIKELNNRIKKLKKRKAIRLCINYLLFNFVVGV